MSSNRSTDDARPAPGSYSDTTQSSPRDANASNDARLGNGMSPSSTYLVGRRLGVGGMASVFAARQTMFLGNSRLVALKLLHESLSEGDGLKAFRREATLSTRLSHPNIVRTYEVGVHNGHPFMAMELIDGFTMSTMAAQLERTNILLPAPLVCRIVDDVLAGLHYAHELRNTDGTLLGLVHQDVTPHNVMVGFDGISRLLDFGVARLSLVDTSRTETVRGKPAYLAPEQLRGGRLDRRVDLFAVGVILHEMLSGTRLFKRDTIDQTYLAVLTETPPSLRARRPDISKPLDDLVERALAKDPAQRFESAAAMRDAIARLGAPLATHTEAARWLETHHRRTFHLAELEREIRETEESEREARPTVTIVFSSTSSDVATDTVDNGTNGSAGWPTTTTDPQTRSESGATLTASTDHGEPNERRAILDPRTATPPNRPDVANPTMVSRRARQDESSEARVQKVGKGYWLAAMTMLLVAVMAGSLVVYAKPQWLSRWRGSTALSQSPPMSSALPSATPSADPPTSASVDVSTPSTAEASSNTPPPTAPQPRALAKRGLKPTPKASSAPADPPPAPSSATASTIASSTAAPAPPPILKIWSNVSGAVFVDGVYVGPSPMSHTTTPGRHTVLIRTESGERSVSIDVPSTGVKQERFVF